MNFTPLYIRCSFSLLLLSLAAVCPQFLFAAESQDTSSAAFAQTGPILDNLRQLQPSSRRTGLIISEFMYHPLDRPDSNNLEFVELFNSQPFDHDISGFHLQGDISYTFPAGTVISQRSFLVVAKNPAAMENTYGLSDCYGPFDDTLGNRDGELRLVNNLGAVLIDISYEDRYPWPVQPDGAGHSLVLARPDFGEADVNAWSPSAVIGGSPGAVDPGNHDDSDVS